MSFETQNGTSFEKKDLGTKNPEVTWLIDSIGFKDPNTLKKLSTLSPETQAWLLPWIQNITENHRLHMESIQWESTIWYQKALNNPISVA
jgi:hypothetical protein